MTKRPLTSKRHEANNLLELVHSDVCGLFKVHAREGYEYFITFIDNYSRYGYACLIHYKFETLKNFGEFLD